MRLELFRRLDSHDRRIRQLERTEAETDGGGGGDGLPVGAVTAWLTATAPTGWLLCDGAAIPAGYTELIALVGANTPDLRGRVPLGASGSYPLASTGGAASVTLATGHLPSHNHGSGGAHGHLYDVGGATPGTANSVLQRSSGGVVTSISGAIQTSALHTHNVVGSDTPFSVLNPYLALNFIIKAQ